MSKLYKALEQIESILDDELDSTPENIEATKALRGKIHRIAYCALEAADSAPAPQKQYRIASRHRSSTNMRYSDWVDEVHRGKVEDAAREMIDNEQYSVVQMEVRSVSVAVAVDIREVAISE
jgi:hypothetical protein